MNKKSKLIITPMLTMLISNCSFLDRSDRFREFETHKGVRIGINITDATRRLAIIHSNGRTCSELSPPAVLEVDKSFKGEVSVDQNSNAKGSLGAEGKKKTVAVTLTTTTEKIECIRIALFHACGLAEANNMPADKEIGLYSEILAKCSEFD